MKNKENRKLKDKEIKKVSGGKYPTNTYEQGPRHIAGDTIYFVLYPAIPPAYPEFDIYGTVNNVDWDSDKRQFVYNVSIGKTTLFVGTTPAHYLNPQTLIVKEEEVIY